MKLIQSWWDIAGRNKLPEKDIPIIELSRMTLEHNFGQKITFYTSLKNTDGLKYSDVKPLDMSGYRGDLWCSGKLKAIAQQTEPFVHMDLDLFLWKQTPIKTLELPFIVFHHETWAQQFLEYANKIPPPPSLKNGYDYFDSQNFAIVGGTNWKDLVECCQEILEHLKTHQDEIIEIAHDKEIKNGTQRLMWTPVVIEQVWISQMMRKRKIPPKSFLGDKWKPFNPFYHSNIHYRANKRGISHFWAYTKDERYDELIEAYKKWKAYLEPFEKENKIST
jgi:hypothetical protein